MTAMVLRQKHWLKQTVDNTYVSFHHAATKHEFRYRTAVSLDTEHAWQAARNIDLVQAATNLAPHSPLPVFSGPVTGYSHSEIPPAFPARVPHPEGYRVLELTAGLVVISIAFTPDLRD